MPRLNLTEQRVLRRGETILRTRRNKDTGDLYDVEVKMSWGRLYYRIPDADSLEWWKTPVEARRAS